MEMLVGLLVFFAVLAAMTARFNRAPGRRLGAFLNQRRASPETEAASSAQVKLAWLEAIEKEAEQAGVAIAARQFLLVAALAAGVAFAIAYAVFGRWPVAVLAALVGIFAPRLWLARRKTARQEAIARQLDGALERMASAMLAGQSLRQAIATAARDVPAPLGDELERAADVLGLGESPEQALRSVQQRVGLREFEQVVVAVAMQTQAGGNLAENLREIAEAVRDQRGLRADVIAATTEGRRSAYFVAGIALLMVGGIALLNPGFFAPLLAMPFGRFILSLSGVMMLIGLVWVRRLMEVPWE